MKKCLTPVMKDVTFFTRDYKFVTIEGRFSSADKTRELSDRTLKTEEVVRPVLGSRRCHLKSILLG